MTSYEPPERLKHVFDFYGITPEHRPDAAESLGAATGFVYLIQCHEYFKIGIADNPQARVTLLQVGNPYELRLIKVYPSTDPAADELVLQGRLAKYHERGEWYLLPPSVVRALLALHDISVLYWSGSPSGEQQAILGALPPRPRFYRFVVRLNGQRVFAGRVGTTSSDSPTYIRASRWNKVSAADQPAVDAAIRSYESSVDTNTRTYVIEYPQGTPDTRTSDDQ